MSSTSVHVMVNATLDADGHVVCDLSCNSQRAKVIFTGTEVITEVNEPATGGQAALDVCQQAPNELHGNYLAPENL